MTIDEAKTEIEKRFPKCSVKSAVPFKNGFVMYAFESEDEIADPLFIDDSKKVIPFNPFTSDMTGYESAMLGIVYF